MTERTSR